MHFLWILSLLTRSSSIIRTARVSEPDAKAIVDEYLFELTLPEFIFRREVQDPPTVIWDSNGCSYTSENPLGFPFGPACQHHDFGYRNYKQQERFNSGTKKMVDRNFMNE